MKSSDQDHLPPNSAMLFILEILKGKDVELQEIQGKNCFVVSFRDFHAIYEMLAKSTVLYPSSVLTKAHFHNFEFRTTAEETYFICTPAEPVLDNLWKEKYKPPIAEVQPKE